MAVSDIEALLTTVAEEGALHQKVEALLCGLAERLKSTSNDQNVQKLSRELRAVAPRLIEAFVAKADA